MLAPMASERGTPATVSPTSERRPAGTVAVATDTLCDRNLRPFDSRGLHDDCAQMGAQICTAPRVTSYGHTESEVGDPDRYVLPTRAHEQSVSRIRVLGILAKTRTAVACTSRANPVGDGCEGRTRPNRLSARAPRQTPSEPIRQAGPLYCSRTGSGRGDAAPSSSPKAPPA